MKIFSQWITRHAKAVFAIWVILFIMMTYFAIQLPEKLQGDGFVMDADHSATMGELTNTFDLPEKTILVLFDHKTPDDIQRILEKLREVDEITETVSPNGVPELNKDGYSYALLYFGDGINDYFPIVDEIRTILHSEKGVSITGEPVISKDINVASQQDLMQAETIGLPIALVILLLAFGTIVASLLPIIIGIISIIITFGLLALFGETFDLSIFILNIVPMLGLALSIDFALLFINRFREERAHTTVEEAVQIAIQTAGRSIIFSALCVIIGLGSMVVIQVDIFSNIALSGSIVVLVAVISGLTLLPATLVLLGDRLNKWRLIRIKPTASRWQSFATFVMHHPLKIIFLSVAMLLIAMIPLKDIDLTIPTQEALPTSYESRQAYDQLDETFKIAETTAVYLLAEQQEGWTENEALQKTLDIQQQLLEKPLVKKIDSFFTTTNIETVEMWNTAMASSEGQVQLQQAFNYFVQDTKMYIKITLDSAGSSKESQSFVRELSNENLGVHFTLGGPAKFNQEIFDEIAHKIGLAVLIIMMATFIVLMLAFRSILIPLKAIIMNVIGLGSTFGIIVYIFQYGHFGLPEGTTALIMPVIVFCLVFGLSMDYEVFLISRIQEEYLNGATNTKATIDGLVSTSKIITSAALIMIVITGAFAFTDVMPVKQIGVGIAIAIAIDATVIRLMLVPSLMKLLGDWNWWLPFKKAR